MSKETIPEKCANCGSIPKIEYNPDYNNSTKPRKTGSYVASCCDRCCYHESVTQVIKIWNDDNLHNLYCPICGREALIKDGFSYSEKEYYYVQCNNTKCLLMGPHAKDRATAVRLWRGLSYKNMLGRIDPPDPTPKDCPFCGSDAILSAENYVSCCNDDCVAIGPNGGTPENAIRLWNAIEFIHTTPKACPFCGDVAYILRSKGYYFVNCNSGKCCASGPTRTSKLTAVNLWNKINIGDPHDNN